MNKFAYFLLILLLAAAIFLFIENMQLKKELDLTNSPVERDSSSQQRNTVKQDPNERQQNDLISDFLNQESLYDIRNDSIQTRNRFSPDLFPVQYDMVVSQKFSETHQGVDLAAPLGSRVLAAAGGKIKEVKLDKYYGNMIIIDHLNGLFSYYAHLNDVAVKKNFFVEKGDVVGTVGSTGFSTGPHLHFAIQNNKGFIDPSQYWQQ